LVRIKVIDILEQKERNLNWLSKKCDITYSTLYNFAMGKTNAVSYNILESVCDALDCKVEDILEIIKED